ncbi:MAG: HAD-IB family hydrolase [Acidimicrobiales bacterium]
MDLVVAAFFDLDKTVIAKASLAAFGPSLHRAGYLSKWLVARAIWAQFFFTRFGADEAKLRKFRKTALKVAHGWEKDEIQSLVRATLADVIEPIVYLEALELIGEHRAKGHRIYLVSASPSEIVEPLGEFLGIDEVIATKAKLDEFGRYTGEVAFNSFGANKVVAMKASAEKHGIDLAASWAYSDSATDVPMLSAVGNPVVVNPDRELRRVAQARGWPIRKFSEFAPLPHKGASARRKVLGGGVVLAAGAAAASVLWRGTQR